MTGAESPRAHAVALALFAVAGLVTVGRLALEAWLVRPEPPALPLASAAPAAGGPPPALLLVVVDGLREEATRNDPDPAMPAWLALEKEGVGGIAVAGDPTLTACCVRTLLTGRAPDLYTAFENFTAKPVSGSLIELCAARGARAAHAGDAAAWQMAGRFYRAEDVLAFPDPGPTAQGGTDDRAFPFALRKAREGACSVMTVHLVRPDHAGHKFGATGAEYRLACGTVDRQIGELVAAFRERFPEATVLLAADHGVTSRGTHGGGEPGARRAPFALLGPRIARLARVELAQSSLAPTVAAALGLPPTPLAETPPALGLTTLSPDERARFLSDYVRARAEVAARTGAVDLATAIEAKRAKVQLGRGTAALAELGAVSAELEAALGRRDRPLDAGLALVGALLFLALLATAGAGAPACGRPALVLGALAVVAAFAAPLGIAGLTGALSGGALLRGRARVDGRLAAFAVALVGAVAVVCGAGAALQGAFDAAEDLGAVSARTGAALGVALAAIAGFFWIGRRRARGGLRSALDAHPAALPLAAGLVLGFGLSLRMFVDPYVHTTLLFAAAALGGAVSVARGSVIARLAFAALIVGGRVLEAAWGADGALAAGASGPAWLVAIAGIAAALCVSLWLAARAPGDRAVAAGATAATAAAVVFRLVPEAREVAWGLALAAGVLSLLAAAFAPTPAVRLSARLLAVVALAVPLHDRSDAQILGIALLALACRAAAELRAPSTRVGLAGLAVAILCVRIGAFHALGFTESFSAVDVGAAFAPGAGRVAATGGGLTGATALAVALLSLKFALVWIAPLAAAAHALRRDGAARALGTLAGDLVVALAARGPALVAALWVFSRSSWWVKSGYTVYLFGAADVVLVAAAFGLTALEARGDRAPAPIACAPADAPARV